MTTRAQALLEVSQKQWVVDNPDANDPVIQDGDIFNVVLDSGDFSKATVTQAGDVIDLLPDGPVNISFVGDVLSIAYSVTVSGATSSVDLVFDLGANPMRFTYTITMGIMPFDDDGENGGGREGQ